MDATPPLDDDAVRWQGEPDGAAVIVLLHGYGSDENDLFALRSSLPDRFAYASVRAPLGMPWPQQGHFWYPVDGPDARDVARTTAAAGRFVEWTERALSGAASVGLIGFSQGGAISLQALRLRPDRFAFVVNLSGYATPGDLAGDAVLAATRPPVFWGRGTLDTVIPGPLVDHTTEWLPAHSELTGRIYPGLGHAVSPDVLADVDAFLLRAHP